MLDSCAFWAGLRCFDPTTVLPVLLARLGASDRLIGVTGFIQTLGFTLPALFAAHYIHGRARHKGFLLVTCGLARIGLVTLPAVLLLYARSHPSFVLGWFLFVFSVFWLLDGACAVSWFDIVAKSIPGRVRGRFFGTMQMVGGLMGIAAGWIVATVLRPGGMGFPANFALLAGFWLAGNLGSQIVLCLIREPEGYTAEEPGEARAGFGAYLRQALPMLRRNPGLGRLMAARVVLSGVGVATPFYVLFAQRHLHISLAMVGVYSVLQSLGNVCTGQIWGYLSDRFGPVFAFRCVAGVVVLMPVLALTAATGSAWALPIVFFAMGGVQDGLWMVGSNVLLERVSAADRPLAVGVSSVFQMPAALYSVIGGLLAVAAGYTVVFAVALVFAASGFMIALRLPVGKRVQEA